MLLIAAMVSLVLLAGCTSSGKTGQSNANTQPPAPVPTVETPKSQETAPTPAPVVEPQPTPDVKTEEPKPITPVDCNPLKDKTCTTLAVGQEALVNNQLKLKVSNINTQRCEKAYQGAEPEDYLVFDVDMENVGDAGTVYVGSSVFYVLDSTRSQKDGSIFSYPYGGSLYSTEACKNAESSALESGNIVPGSRSSGKVWIELKKPLPTGESYIVYKSLFNDKMVFFKFNAS
jgi:hypothetical protein